MVVAGLMLQQSLQSMDSGLITMMEPGHRAVGITNLISRRSRHCLKDFKSIGHRIVVVLHQHAMGEEACFGLMR
ncbi:hypothetical protein FRX31_016406 [Thalictrum thalictroides]|uniref:Uncharacterized protein n=1 Tax=Thalictrum thalictroides TaxID=46969 RepID=A0A7J6WAV0_THATH|nr:hypothetical protein FRX31_016406 [Thalictrum thalictroides]